MTAETKLARLDRSVPPAGGRLRPFHFPKLLRQTLPNGLEVLAARLPDVPLVSLELVTPASLATDARLEVVHSDFPSVR